MINLNLLIGVFFLAATNVSANAVAFDSVADFSATQGESGWLYGYYDGDVANPFSPDDFEALTEFNNNRWSLQEGSGGFWTYLWSTGGHPNGTTPIGGRQLIEHWAVRRWVSDVNGLLSLQGNLSKSTGAHGGNGVVGHIFVDGIEVFSQHISGFDGVGINYSLDVDISVGSIIDFAIDPFQASEAVDSTTFTALGTLASPVPVPATVWLFSSGLLGVIGMRKKSLKLSRK